MAPKAPSFELVRAMKELRLGQIVPTLADRITLAEKGDLPIEDFLLGLFTDEIERRRDASSTRRAHQAGLEPDMQFERWDKTAKVSFDRDFALEPMTRDESRDIYQLIIERTGKAATIVTNNRDTADWLAVFDDPLLGQGAVDRFKNNAYDLVVDGESYRSRLKPSVDKDGPPPSAPVTKPKPLLRRHKRARP